MSALRLDPRVNKERVYQYQDYRHLSQKFKRRRKLAWWERFMLRNRSIGGEQRMAPRPVRLLRYKLNMAAAAMVLTGSFIGNALIQADTARLEYRRQELKASIGGLQQAQSEAIESNLSEQAKVLNGKVVSAAEISDPMLTRYVTVPGASGDTDTTVLDEDYELGGSAVTVER